MLEEHYQNNGDKYPHILSKRLGTSASHQSISKQNIIQGHLNCKLQVEGTYLKAGVYSNLASMVMLKKVVVLWLVAMTMVAVAVAASARSLSTRVKTLEGFAIIEVKCREK